MTKQRVRSTTPLANRRQSRNRALNQFLIDSLTEYAVFAVSPDGLVMSWNAGAEKTFGYTQSEIIGRSFDVIFTSHDVAAGAPRAELSGALSGEHHHHDRWHVRKDGSRFWGINTVQPLYNSSGALLGFTKLVRDTTVSHLAIEALTDSEQRFRLLVESVRGYAIMSLDLDGTITSWSAGAERVFSFTQADVSGKNFSMLFRSDDVDAGLPAIELRKASRSESVDVEGWLVRKDGSTFLANGKTSQLKTDIAGDLRGFVKLVYDTTEQHLAAEEMRRRAQFDALTQLPNRRTFYEHVQRAISLVKRRASQVFAVLFIDLDHFKAINDEFGHIVADKVLAVIARRLESCVRSEDIVSRVGGDEFAILLNGINRVLDADDAAQRILKEMREAVKTDAGNVFAAVSVGIAIGNAKYNSPEDILQDADAAMYVAKLQGRARAVMFEESIGQVVRDNVDLTTSLRHAIDRNELRIMYQPVFRLRDMAIVGLEALVRWKHPRLGLLQPSGFIPQAEESNLIVSIDHWMLTRVCQQIMDWHSRRIIRWPFQISVNVSSREFSRTNFLDEIQGIIAQTEAPPTSLRLEITESTILDHSPETSHTLAAIRTLGVSVDVDDFGTGYASLGALNQIVVDGLKIDWSFVTGQNAQHGWSIVESVVSLAHKLDIVAIAEGIETTEQLDRLTVFGCDFGQGYLLSHPLGPVAVAAFLRERSRGKSKLRGR